MAGTLPNRTIDISSIVPGLDGKVRPHDPLGLQGGGLHYLIETFDYADNQLPQVFDDGGQQVLQWQAGAANGALSVNPTGGLRGGKCLDYVSTLYGNSKPMHATYYNNRNNTGAGLNNWWYLDEWVNNVDFGRINRLRVWVKLPSNVAFPTAGGGDHNLHVGTFCRDRSVSRVENESSNWHFYHQYGVGYSGNYHQIIVDSHVQHQRSANGATEHGDKWQMTASDSYFDLMTWFYVQHTWQAIAIPSLYQIDHVEWYEETSEYDDVEYVCSLNGVAFHSSVAPNRIYIAWHRRKDDNSASFDVRYAATSFYRNGGWSHGSAAPSGTGLTGFGNIYGGAGCEYITDEIDTTGMDVIWFAVKRTGQSGFREICIPLTDTGYAMMGITA